MTRAEFAVAAIALGATVAVALQDVIKECCTSAHAQTQTASPERTVWEHNGSVMYLVANGSSREIYYQKPRSGMLEAGARPGSLLFRGEVNNGQYLGTAYIFNSHCGPIPYEVKGPILDDDERIMLTGQAPGVGRNCHTYGSYTSNLEFRRSKPNEAAQSQEPLAAAAQPSPIAVSKPEAPSRSSGGSAPTAHPLLKNETPVAAKDSSAGVTNSKVTSIPAGQASVTNETAGAKDLHFYLLGAAFIVMIVWLLIVLFGKILIRRTG
jgi:hypothetical protein